MSLSNTRQIALLPVVEAFTSAVSTGNGAGGPPEERQRSKILDRLNLIEMAFSMAGPEGGVKELGDVGAGDVDAAYLALKNFVGRG
jgi:hypothetical protein